MAERWPLVEVRLYISLVHQYQYVKLGNYDSNIIF